jgi:transcriptional regulator with XRE-family HTH domain
MDTQSIADIVRQVRLSKGYTLKKLSELSGVHYNSIRAIEQARANPSIDTLDRIAAALETVIQIEVGGGDESA